MSLTRGGTFVQHQPRRNGSKVLSHLGRHRHGWAESGLWLHCPMDSSQWPLPVTSREEEEALPGAAGAGRCFRDPLHCQPSEHVNQESPAQPRAGPGAMSGNRSAHSKPLKGSQHTLLQLGFGISVDKYSIIPSGCWVFSILHFHECQMN